MGYLPAKAGPNPEHNGGHSQKRAVNCYLAWRVIGTMFLREPQSPKTTVKNNRHVPGVQVGEGGQRQSGANLSRTTTMLPSAAGSHYRYGYATDAGRHPVLLSADAVHRNNTTPTDKTASTPHRLALSSYFTIPFGNAQKGPRQLCSPKGRRGSPTLAAVSGGPVYSSGKSDA